MDQFDPKDYEEGYAVGFIFDAEMSAITYASVAVQLLDGIDDNPTAILSGAPQISGTGVYQRLTGGVTGCTYKFRCKATDSGAANETFVKTASIRVETA